MRFALAHISGPSNLTVHLIICCAFVKLAIIPSKSVAHLALATLAIPFTVNGDKS